MLDIVEYIFDKNLILTNKPEEVIVGQILTEQVLESAFGKNTYGGSIGGNHYMYGSNFKNRDLTYTLSRSIDNSYSIAHTKNSVELAEVIDNNRAKSEFSNACKTLYNSLPSGIRKVAAERNIVPEEQNGCVVLPNGIGATSIISTYLNDSKKDEKLVEEELLSTFNEISCRLIINLGFSFVYFL